MGRVEAQQLAQLLYQGQGGLERALDPGNRGCEPDFSNEGAVSHGRADTQRRSILHQHSEEAK